MTNVNISIGGGFFGLLTILFIVLKLLDKIDWSWFWVISPLLIPIGLVVFIFLIICVIALIVSIAEAFI